AGEPPVGRRKIALSRECYTLPYYWALGGFLWTPATRALHDVRPCQAPGRCEKRDGGLAIRTSGARACSGATTSGAPTATSMRVTDCRGDAFSSRRTGWPG